MSVGGHIFSGDKFSGTFMTYAADKWRVLPILCSVEIHSMEDSDVGETRAARWERRMAGGTVEKLRKDTLHNELVVVLGANLSAEAAVCALTKIIDSIQREGMLIGRTKDDNYAVETVDGEVTVP
jgi:hypothetical protein